jgi:hypothetical protein
MVDRKSQWLDAHGARHKIAAPARQHAANAGGRQRSPAVTLSATLLMCCACGQKPAEPAPAAPEPAKEAAPLVQAAPQPPVFEFKAPEPFKSRDGSKVVPPPDLAVETWRVMTNQTEPMQHKNPWWQPLPADKTVELEMAPGAKFRCMSPPLRVTVEPDEDQVDVEAWDLKRSILCTSDDYRTWNETQLHVRITNKGKRKTGPDAGMMLRQRADDGKIIETFVVMRADKDKSGPTYGPPRIIEAKKGDDDDE